MISNKSIEKHILNLFELIKNHRNIIIYGSNGSKKSFLIRIFAYIFSSFSNKGFLLHWLKLDSIEKTSLIGQFSEKKWQKGLFETFLEAFDNEKELLTYPVNFQKKDISSNALFNFSSEFANSEYPEKKFSNYDWIVLDNRSLGEYYEALFEMIINRTIYQENGGKLKIDIGLSIFLEVFYIIINKIHVIRF